MKEKRDKTDQYYSCQCIRMIVGRIKNDMIHTGLASRLRMLLSMAYNVDDEEVSKIIANFYWDKNRSVYPKDLSELLDVINKNRKLIIRDKGELWDEVFRVVSLFEEFGWGVNQFKEMYLVGIPHVEVLIKKRGGIW